MGKYDAIQSGPVTIEASDDFWTSALKKYLSERDRKERLDKEAKDRKYQSEQSAEQKRRFDATMDFNKDKEEKDDWNLMIEQAETPAQKKIIAHAGVTAGHLPAASLDVFSDAVIKDETQKDLIKGYYSADDASKVELWPKLRDTLIENNSPLLTKLEQDAKIRKENQSNLQMANLLVSQYPQVFTKATQSYIEGASTLSPEHIKTFTTMVSSHLDNTTKNYKAGMDAAMDMINRDAPGIDATEEDRLRHRAIVHMGMELKNQLQPMVTDDTTDTRTSPYPELGQFDSEVEEKDRLKGTFDNLSQEEKSRQFASAMDELGITKESWGNMKDNEERAIKGREVIDYINKKDYSRVVEPAKSAGFAGIQYEDPRGSIEITDEMIDENLQMVMDDVLRVPKEQQKNPTIIAQAKKRTKELLRKELQKRSKQKATKIATETMPTFRTGPFGFGN